jgi:hypothetical protein
MSGYNTNLAAEFYILSVLHRLGAEANLTLGNKKSVDIAIVRSAGDAITVDVKGLAGKTGWPVDNVKAGTPNHYIAFVCYIGKIDDPNILPEVYIVPSLEFAKPILHCAPGGRKLVRLSEIRKAGKYRDAWKQLVS